MKFTAALLVILGLMATWSWGRFRQDHGAASFGGLPPLRTGVSAEQRVTFHLQPHNFLKNVAAYEDLTGRSLHLDSERLAHKLDRLSGHQLSRRGLVSVPVRIDSGLHFHGDGLHRASEVKEELETYFLRAGLEPVASGARWFRLRPPAREP